MRSTLILGGILSIVAGHIKYVTCESDNKFPEVITPSGKIQGTFQKDLNGATYMQFLGIPFAKPPVGKLRFAEPQPADSWDHIWIANSTNICMQVDHYDVPQEGITKGEEDCLYVNVFVPGGKVETNHELDVIVHIHGGGFMFGSSLVYAWPTRLMNKGVIFVSLQYRLGVLGFLSTEDKYQPGNLGLKDQTLALKWIQKHIRSFGGNPKSVTISGMSAGAASVHFHLLSPLSRGLFHRAISASGNALDPWAMYEAPLQKAKQLGKKVGCQFKSSKDLIKCLRHRPASQLVEATKSFRKWAFLPFSPFGVVVDSSAEKPFLPQHPYQLLKEGNIYDVPWIASLTTAEGLYPVAQLPQRKEYFDQLRDNWNKYLPLLLHYEQTIPKKQLAEVSQRIKEEYLGDREVSRETFPEIIKMASDRLFVNEMQKAARLHATAVKSPVYFYVYDYVSEQVNKLPHLLFEDNSNYGVSHADDTLMIFEREGKGSQQDQMIINVLQNMWLTFAKTGKPHLENWQELSKESVDPINYLYIESPANIEMRTSDDLTKGKMFWDNLPFAEGEKLLRQYLKTEL